ncbi:OsmC family protein, partial [Rhizobiaceae bacterium]|nr:OsmC family protein [Rhizobiaceae bacterium]
MMRLKTNVKLRAKAHCPTHSLANVEVRDVTLAIDEPQERGGTNLGPTPTETALAALVGCTNTIGHKCAESLGIEIGDLDISCVCEFDRRGVTLA